MMLQVSKKICGFLLQILVCFSVVASATQSNLEVLYESNSNANPSWSYTLLPSEFPLTWRAAAELCESIPGAMMAKVRNEETVKIMLRFLQLSRHNSPVWIRNRQTITEALARERSDVPGLNEYSEKNSTFSYPSEGKAGLTLRCSLIRPKVGITTELCNNLSAFGAICIQPVVKTSRPFLDMCPISSNRPWMFLRRYKILSSDAAKTIVTSLSACSGEIESYSEFKCHPKKGWLETKLCSEEADSETNVLHTPPNILWASFKAKGKLRSYYSKDLVEYLVRPTFPHKNKRSKRSDHPDSIDLIERIMRNITAEINEKHERNYSKTSGENTKNVSFSINVHNSSSNIDSNSTSNKSVHPILLQLNMAHVPTITIEENEIPKYTSPNKQDKIHILAEEIVKYLNYSSGEEQTYLNGPEYNRTYIPKNNLRHSLTQIGSTGKFGSRSERESKVPLYLIANVTLTNPKAILDGHSMIASKTEDAHKDLLKLTNSSLGYKTNKTDNEDSAIKNSYVKAPTDISNTKLSANLKHPIIKIPTKDLGSTVFKDNIYIDEGNLFVQRLQDNDKSILIKDNFTFVEDVKNSSKAEETIDSFLNIEGKHNLNIFNDHSSTTTTQSTPQRNVTSPTKSENPNKIDVASSVANYINNINVGTEVESSKIDQLENAKPETSDQSPPTESKPKLTNIHNAKTGFVDFILRKIFTWN